MNFIADSNHVDVMIALDLKKLRFVKEMDDNDGPFTGGTMQPTMWATVTGTLIRRTTRRRMMSLSGIWRRL